MNLLTINNDPKTIKSLKKHEILTAVLYGAPANTAGVGNQCPDASEACKAACLFTAGRASFDVRIPAARIKRTKLFVRHKAKFFDKLISEIDAFVRKCQRLGYTPAIRMNGTTDIPWERVKIRGTRFDGLTLHAAYPNIQFYDYTKTTRRLGNTPDNYYLLASKSENMTWEQADAIVNNNFNVAVVFRVCEHVGNCKCPLPMVWRGKTVINGDAHDARHKDGLTGVWVGLKAKGKAKQDKGGFVVNVINAMLRRFPRYGIAA